jgi:hypothetical protein
MSAISLAATVIFWLEPPLTAEPKPAVINRAALVRLGELSYRQGEKSLRIASSGL